MLGAELQAAPNQTLVFQREWHWRAPCLRVQTTRHLHFFLSMVFTLLRGLLIAWVIQGETELSGGCTSGWCLSTQAKVELNS